MRHLIELVELLGENPLPYIGDDARGRQIRLLLQYVKNTEQPTDREAATAIGLKPGSSTYRKYKHYLKFALLNGITALHPINHREADRKRAYNFVWRLITIGKSLRVSVGSEVLLPYLEQAFKLAVKHSMLDAAFETATMLRRQYTNRQFDRNKYQFYRKQASHYREVSRAYQDVVADLNEVIYLRNVRHAPADLAEFATACYHQHAPLIDRYNLAMISYLIYFIKVNAHLAVRDYEQLIATATQAIDYLDGCPTTLPSMYQVFEANLSVAYAQRNDYTNGIAFAHRMLSKTSPNEYNYLKVNELILILNLRSGKFQEAYEAFIKIDQRRLRKNLLAYYRETFDIIEAYLYLLISMQQIVEPEGESRFSRFRINKFLNSFDYSNAEKGHRNVHLLIIKIIDHLLHRRHRQTMDSIEAITKYTQRHLRSAELKRAKYFVKALAQLSVQAFHREAVERNTGRIIKRLDEYPLRESKQDYEMELVPYDVLWRLILDELGYKRIVLRGQRST